VTSADGDFINGDLTQVLELDPAELATQITVLDVLNEIPTDLQMFRHVPDGHPLGQFQDVPLEGLGVAASCVREVDGHLTHRATVRTAHARHLQYDLDGAGTDGKTAKATHLESSADHPLGPASRTAKIPSFLTDGEDHLAALIRGLHIVVAANPKPMIQ
jgi:hypothetical protein